jgi:RNA polymerase sigma factor (sigma-70 family)
MDLSDKTPLQILLGDYEKLLEQLTQRLGSRERADHALQETHRRLERDGGESATELNLLQMAVDIASAGETAPGSGTASPAGEERHSEALLQVLLRDYGFILKRLTHSLGAADLADEALQETYLRLRRGGIGVVHNPRNYVSSMAFNIGRNILRRENRYMPVGPAEAFDWLTDDGPPPDKILEMQWEQQILRAAIAALPPARRDIFEAAFIHNEPQPGLAARYGVSVRTIRREIARALEHIQRAREKSYAPGRPKGPPRGVT